MISAVRRLLIGTPLPTHQMEHEKVGVLSGLAVFASDALSSVAYGTEEVLIILAVAGAAGIRYVLPIGVAIAVLVVIVAISYRQTVVEYPSGGGAYVVARENLGALPSHIAAAALLTDYVLTVAVSVAAGVAAITSAWPFWYEHRVALGVGCVLVIMFVNLRGVRESAAVFSIPVYGFIGCMMTLVVVGLSRLLGGGLRPLAPQAPLIAQEPVTAFLVLRAFASGCATLTGLEAVANGVQAFRRPRGKNAAEVMALMGVLLSAMTLGIVLLAHFLHTTPLEKETVVSQIARVVFGRGGMYYLIQFATAFILILAANTSFADFPRLSAFMAQDGYMPRQFSNIGDRLVYSNGIIALAVLASVLIIVFRGTVNLLIPLYAVGVFSAFTLSQSGMVVHWHRKGGSNWRHKAAVNGLGACVTGVVLVIIAVTKFVHGAWIVCIIIPSLVVVFRAIHRHYSYVAAQLSLEQAGRVRPLRNLNILLVGGMHRGTLEALQYAKSLSGEIRAVHVEVVGESTPRVQRLWSQWEPDMPLIVLPSPYRNMVEPLVAYIEQVKQQEGYDVVTVILPEFVVDTWWESLLHNHSALWLQLVLRTIPGVAVLNMRYRL
jgi:amino acid transporter